VRYPKQPKTSQWLIPAIIALIIGVVTAGGATWGLITFDLRLKEQAEQAKAKSAAEQAAWEHAHLAQSKGKEEESTAQPMRPSLIIRKGTNTEQLYTAGSAVSSVRRFSFTTSGTGTTTTNRINLPAGLLVASLTASGNGNAILKIVPVTGRSSSDNIAIINEVVDGGSRSYRTTFTVEQAGEFILQYQGDTTWNVTLNEA
jgi:hypothetical protein